MRIILFLAVLPDLIRGGCKDTDNGATDANNGGCDYYSNHVGKCGERDDDDFMAHKMCCVCKNSIYETVKLNVLCQSDDMKLETYNYVRDCAEACRAIPGCQYFSFGKNTVDNKCFGQCWWMKTKSADCPEGFKPEGYNFYKMKINIVDEAKTNADLTKFVGAIEKAGLEEELKGDGSFTVFAPINAAFEAKKDELEKEDLKKILLRHVVPEKLMPYDIPRGITTKQTAGDEKIDVIKAIFPAKNQDTIVIKSSAGNGIVINQPIDALNGVIHIVNEIF